MQACKGRAHVGFEHLQAWRLSGQPVLAFDHPHIQKSIFLHIKKIVLCLKYFLVLKLIINLQILDLSAHKLQVIICFFSA